MSGTIEENIQKSYTIRLCAEQSDRVIVVTEKELSELTRLIYEFTKLERMKQYA